MPVVVSITHLLLLHYYNWWSCWGVKSAGEWIWFSCLSASCRQTSKVSKKNVFGGVIWFDCLCDLFLQVPMMHGATPATVSAATTSATSVPFATATANQVCLPPVPPPPSPALTFFFPLASYDSHVLYKKMHEWCTGLIPDLCQLLTAFFIQEIIAWLFICVHWNAACPYLHWNVCFFFFTSIHATDFFLPLVFPSHTDSSYICRPPD